MLGIRPVLSREFSAAGQPRQAWTGRYPRPGHAFGRWKGGGKKLWTRICGPGLPAFGTGSGRTSNAQRPTKCAEPPLPTAGIARYARVVESRCASPSPYLLLGPVAAALRGGVLAVGAELS